MFGLWGGTMINKQRIEFDEQTNCHRQKLLVDRPCILGWISLLGDKEIRI